LIFISRYFEKMIGYTRNVKAETREVETEILRLYLEDRFFHRTLHSFGLRGSDFEDHVQEAVCYALFRAEKYDPARGTLNTWLYKLATCRTIDTLRKDRNRGRSIKPLGEDLEGSFLDIFSIQDADSVDEVAHSEDLGRTVRSVLGDLNEEDRSILRLRHLERATWGNIGEELGLTSEQVKYRFKRASSRFRKSFGGSGLTGEYI
jgi:RNA polymerase sigma factor (sigma-70 family)